MPACNVDLGCDKPSEHTSTTCYARYVEMEYEGESGGPLMSHAQWRLVARLLSPSTRTNA